MANVEEVFAEASKSYARPFKSATTGCQAIWSVILARNTRTWDKQSRRIQK
jgi:hypothetical protein